MLLGFRDQALMRRVMERQSRRFTYSIPVTTVAATATIQATASVESASDFVCNRVTGRIWFDAGADINRAIDFTVTQQPRLEIIDQASGASLFDRPDVNFENFFGTALFPLELSRPHVFEARTVITVIIVNPSATALRVQVAFHGYKEYRKAAA